MLSKREIQSWFTPRNTLALALVLIGFSLQIYAGLGHGQPYLSGADVGLIMFGAVLEILGYLVSVRQN